MIVRFLILAFLFYILYRLFRGFKGLAGPAPRDEMRGGVIDDMIQDPQFGTYIPKGEAVRRRIDGEDRYFCSEACADRYEKEKRKNG